MFHLPDVIIDYIYSFDDNGYHKQLYSIVMKELNMWYSWRRTMIFIKNKQDTYMIYNQHHTKRNKPTITLSKYILHVAKNYSEFVYVNNMKWKLKQTVQKTHKKYNSNI